jgi:site-specific recombinase XerD/ribosomal protein L40E
LQVYDVHRYEKKLSYTENRIKKLENSSVIKLIFQFRDACFASGIKAPRIEKHLDNLSRIAKWLGKSFEDTTKEDIEKILARLERANALSDWTKYDYKRTIKTFFTWLGKKEIVEWIVLTIPSKNKLPDEILTEEEIQKMVDACENLRDKAMVAVLYESGTRVGEFLKMKIRDIVFDNKGAVIQVTGKTGDRRIRLVASVPYLAQWLDAHPLKHNRNAFVWLSLQRNLNIERNGNKPMEYDALRMQLKKIAKRAGIEKRIYPHLFRHSRATHLAKWLTEAQMCEFFGWVQGSDMPRIYVHLSGRDVDDAILSMYGIENREMEKPKMEVVKCDRCKAINPKDAQVCMRCGIPLVDAVDEWYWEKKKEEALTAYVMNSTFGKAIMNMAKEMQELKMILEEMRKK